MRRIRLRGGYASRAAREIVLVGHGTGKSSAVSVLEQFLKKHHFELWQRVQSIVVVDLSALTRPEIEAIAKRHMANIA